MLHQKTYQKKKTDIYTIHYINEDGRRIHVFSPYQQIIIEIQSMGIVTTNVTIKEISNKISLLALDNYMVLQNASQNQITLLKEKQLKYRVLLHYLKELIYWLYDFNINKMPNDVKLDYQLTKQ